MKWQRGYQIFDSKIHGGAIEIRAGGFGTVLFQLPYPKPDEENPSVNVEAIKLVEKDNKLIAYSPNLRTLFRNFSGIDSACRIDVKDKDNGVRMKLYEKSTS